MLHALWYCKSGISFTVLSTLEGAQNQRVVGGAQSMADCMRDKLGDAVRLEEPVVAIDQRDDNAVVVTTSKGVHRGRSVILAVPPQLALQMSFSPVLPAQKMKLLHNMPMGAYWKVFATYDTPFWREDGYRGEVVAPDCYMTFINDATPASEKHGVLMGFVVASKAMEWLDMPQDKRDEIALRELAACYGPRAASPQKLNMHTMMEDKWSGGCPVAVPTPGQWTSLGHWIRKPIGKIHWAGTETAIHWSGYMEGAVNSGLRAADEVVAVLGAGSASKSGSGSGTPPVLSP
jgi:monoamine oxidase